MKKIIYISIGAIWLVLFSIVVFGVVSAPDFDAMANLRRYKTIGQDYLDRKQIDPSAVVLQSPDDEFVLLYAKYMQAFQNSENAYSAQHRLFKVAIEPQNLQNPLLIEGAYQKLDALTKQTQASYELLAKAQQKAIESTKLLKEKEKELVVYGVVLDEVIKEIETSEAQFRDDISKSRLALEKYYRAILDFVTQKQGAYSVENNVISFAAPEDQEYYDQLKQGQKAFEQELTNAFEKYQQTLRESNAKIPVDIN